MIWLLWIDCCGLIAMQLVSTTPPVAQPQVQRGAFKSPYLLHPDCLAKSLQILQDLSRQCRHFLVVLQ